MKLQLDVGRCREASVELCQLVVRDWPAIGSIRYEEGTEDLSLIHEIVHRVNNHDQLIAALEAIAELDGDSEQQVFKLTRFQASQVARAALHAVRSK